MSALVLDRIAVSRNRREILVDVSITFAAGRLTGVIGPNGAGKSTLLDVAAGLLAPTAGTVLLGDTPIATLPRKALAARRAYLPQAPRVDWPISVERVVALGLTAHLPAFGDLPKAWQPKIDTALSRFDLLDLRDRPATQLSGGELARVMLARATIGAPEVLIVDEPTAGLDPRHVLDAGRRLRALADAGCTVIVALHDLDLIAEIADDIVMMKAPGAFSHGTAAALLQNGPLSELYDIDVKVHRDGDCRIIRFLGSKPDQRIEGW